MVDFIHQWSLWTCSQGAAMTTIDEMEVGSVVVIVTPLILEHCGHRNIMDK